MNKRLSTNLLKLTLPLLAAAALIWAFLPRTSIDMLSGGPSADAHHRTADTLVKIPITAGLASASGDNFAATHNSSAAERQQELQWCGGAGEWLHLNLDARYIVEFVELQWTGQTPADPAAAIELLASSDSLEWAPIPFTAASAPGGPGEVLRFAPMPAGHLRILVMPGHTDPLCLRNVAVWGRPEGRVDVVSDWESGDLRQWHGIRVRDTLRQFRTVTHPVRQGRYAAEFTVAPGDTIAGISGERSEASHYDDKWNGYSQETAFDEYYYGWSTLIPEDWSNPHQYGIFMQWHARTQLNPPIAFNIWNDSIGVNFRSGEVTRSAGGRPVYGYDRYHVILQDLHRGKWQDFIVRIRFRPDATGIFEVWHRLEGEARFTQLLSLHQIPTLQFSRDLSFIDKGAEIAYGDGYTTSCYVQHGLYRAKGGDNVNRIYHDNWVRGTTYSAVRARFP